MSVLFTGLYTIQNSNGNFAGLTAGTDGIPITAFSNAYGDLQRWVVTRLGNGQYTIVSAGAPILSAYAGSGNVKEHIFAKAATQEWIITLNGDKYNVSPVGATTYWSFTDNNTGTPATLQNNASAAMTKWSFAKIA